MATTRKFNVRHGLSAGAGTTQREIVSDVGEILDVGVLSNLTTATKTNIVAAINEVNLNSGNAVIAATGEPNGHEDNARSTVSFDNSTRTFTIALASGYTSYGVWTRGTRREITASRSVQIGTATGLYYVYFDAAGTLQYKTTYFDWPNDTPTAYVYWNSAVSQAVFVADERHGIVLDWQTHEYLHRTRGAVIAEGFSISNYTTSGTGSSNSDAQFDMGNGTFFDEDLEVAITHSATPTVGTFTQVLTGGAEIPVYYMSGSSGAWVRDAATKYAAKTSATTLQYNLLTGSTWSTTPATDNRYVVSWVIATNEISAPIIAVMGQEQYQSIGEAEALKFNELILTNFPVVEFRPLWKVIFKTSSGYTNTPKAYIAEVLDLRLISQAGTGGAIVSDHGLLSGLADDDHSQYLHATTTRTGVTSELNTTGKITTTNSIGIGTATPSAALDVLGTAQIRTSAGSTRSFWSTTLDSKSESGSNVALLVQPDQAITHTTGQTLYYPNVFSSALSASSSLSANRPTIYGLANYVNLSYLVSANCVGTAYGFYNSLNRNSTTDISNSGAKNLYGIFNKVTQGASISASASTGTNLTGTHNAIEVYKGNLTTSYVNNNQLSVGNGVDIVNVNTAWGSRWQTNVATGSSITNYIGLDVQYILTTGTSTSLYYGLRLNAPTLFSGATLTARYSVYSDDSLSPMYHAGSVGIGTSSPAQKLHVEGVIRAESLEGKTDPTYKIVPDGYGSTGFGYLRGGGYITESATSNGYFQLGEKYIYGYDDVTGGSINFQTNANSYFMNTGNVGVGITNPTYKLQVNGSFAATTKSFVIPHPTKPSYHLRYGSLEGPENGVYVRGRGREFVIELPEYWTKLIDPDSITVNLTPVGRAQTLWVKKVEGNRVYVGSRCAEIDYFYTVFAERADVDRLEVEVEVEA